MLQRLLENQLYAKTEKCKVHQNSTSLLGLIIALGSIKMGPGTPSSRKELRRFLGFANFYHRFIHNYSMVAAPLNSPTSSKISSFFFGHQPLSRLFLPLRDISPWAPLSSNLTRTTSLSWKWMLQMWGLVQFSLRIPLLKISSIPLLAIPTSSSQPEEL